MINLSSQFVTIPRVKCRSLSARRVSLCSDCFFFMLKMNWTHNRICRRMKYARTSQALSWLDLKRLNVCTVTGEETGWIFELAVTVCWCVSGRRVWLYSFGMISKEKLTWIHSLVSLFSGWLALIYQNWSPKYNFSWIISRNMNIKHEENLQSVINLWISLN